ncbi:PAS domain S-box-containing protein [Actinoplanes octamycinicus]|uniref:histidine kinase n=1 Tax=Actinoplanes octamycinicus TaxID=135948 RepID=A0A7W7MAL1_9ACTN|nr:ATP-binding protein [Actinoplanes octamycinicus]MBB4743041.1 PAS domain S-box-containing protein [Actinoplanes octamycinicus]GIE58104.1 hypothetical protein Aoc01nite_35060 [Actinoplanes octamycinicus]
MTRGTDERMDTLHATGLLTAGPVAALDRLTRLARRLTGARVAAVTLVGDDRQRLVSTDRAGGVLGETRETPLSHSYCRYVVQDRAPLVVPDARRDERLRDNPAIRDYQAVAYAGFPLRSPGGTVLGAFCVVDSEPRDWTEDELQIVGSLAAAAESEISLRLAYVRELAAVARMKAVLYGTAELERQRQLLDEQHTFLQAVLDSLESGVAACDSDGQLILFNRAMRELVGDPRTGYHRLYTADGRDVVDDLPLTRALAGDTVSGQQLVVKLDSSWRHLVANARPIETAHGQRLGAVVALHDVTEAHRAEELRRARHAVAQVLSDATNATDAAIQAVAAITDSLGWVHGEYWTVTEDRRHIERHSAHSSREHAALTDDRPLVYVLGEGLPGLVWARNGEVWWDTATKPEDLVAYGRALPEAGIRVAVGVPVRSGRRTFGVLAFYTDQDLPYDPDTAAMLDAVAAHLGRFVERRWAEDMSLMLADARRSFNRVVEQVDDYVWTVEVPAGEAPRLVYGSPNVTAVFGHGATGTTLTERIHPDDAEILAAFQTALADGGQVEMECRVVGVDGRARWVWTRAKARWDHDRYFIDGISTNVDERRELAEQREALLAQERQQVEQLRGLDRMKDELAALVIHELRNPVGVIRGYSEMLVDSPALAGSERRYATVIERTTLHLQGLVDDLLDLARLNAGHLSIDPRPISGTRLAREVIENHAPSALAKRLTVVDRVAAEVTVHADGRRLRQALDNLLSNAVKYTPEGGTVTVVAEQRGDRVVIEVSDTGIGIPAEQYPHLFSRFFRASNATEAGIKGTGLGLAVTKAIVDAHGGAIAAGPGAEGGTTFTISLPDGTLGSPG